MILYSYTGIQMKPIEWCEWKSITNVIINLIINVNIAYTYVIKRKLSWETNKSNEYKNLSNFIRIFSDYYGQLMWSFITIYQYVNMRSIVNKMESLIFKKIYRYKYHLFIFYGITSIIMAPVTFNEFLLIFDDKKHPNFFEKCYSTLIGYLINQSFMMPLILMAYVKYATVEILKSISINWNKNMIRNEYRKSWMFNYNSNYKQELQELAIINQYFSRILSPLLLICVISVNLDMITLFFWNLNKSEFLFTFIILTSYWNYLFYVIYLDNQIDKLMEKIIKNIQNNQCKCCGQCHQFRLLNFDKLSHRINNNDNEKISIIIKSFYCSNNIRYIEFFEQYFEDFHINLFNICRIDFLFLFNSCLFTMSFIILSLQTTY